MEFYQNERLSIFESLLSLIFPNFYYESVCVVYFPAYIMSSIRNSFHQFCILIDSKMHCMCTTLCLHFLINGNWNYYNTYFTLHSITIIFSQQILIMHMYHLSNLINSSIYPPPEMVHLPSRMSYCLSRSRMPDSYTVIPNHFSSALRDLLCDSSSSLIILLSSSTKSARWTFSMLFFLKKKTSIAQAP